jgi:magnesium-transporting ATPase (P-type)
VIAEHGAELTGGPQLAENIVVLSGGSLASNADLRQRDGDWQIQGNPTEAAFLVAERKLGVTERRVQRFERVAEIPFTSERKRMSTIEKDHEQGDSLVLISKGTPDVLLGRCTRARIGTDVVELQCVDGLTRFRANLVLQCDCAEDLAITHDVQDGRATLSPWGRTFGERLGNRDV